MSAPTVGLCRERVNAIVSQHPAGITAKDLCDRLIELGWATDYLTPRSLGMENNTILRMKP